MKKKNGFTLVETMIALAIIVMVAVGPASLAVRGIFSFSPSRQKIVAAHLAQEGIELIRLVRDNNIACDYLNGPPSWQWDRDPLGGSLRGFVEADTQLSMLPVSCGSVTLSFPRLSANCSRELLFADTGSDAGTYGYQTGNPSGLSRCIEVRSPPTNPETGIPAADQMDITSTVTWTERRAARSIILRERLYNWE